MISIERSILEEKLNNKRIRNFHFHAALLSFVTKRYYRIKGNYFLLYLFKSKVFWRKILQSDLNMEKFRSITDIKLVVKPVLSTRLNMQWSYNEHCDSFTCYLVGHYSGIISRNDIISLKIPINLTSKLL